jgi:outer membrane receptor for ferric coprogen and ferric-rhodotorulic acid
MRASTVLPTTIAALLSAALIPATLCAQTANTPPAAPDQTQAPADQPPVSVTTTPGTPAPNGTVTMSPFEVSSTQAQGYFTPNTTTGTRLSSNIGDIPSSVTVIDRQQLDNTNA